MGRALPILAMLLAVAANPSVADHCETYTTGPTDVDAAGYYAVNDCWHNYCAKAFFSIWVYEESNGIPGLQRDDEVVDDTCHGMIEGDTIVF